MNSDLAFRFLGKLSNDSIRCAQNIESGNVVCACIDAGIALIDMTSSIISYSSECKRTNMLKEQIYESKALLDIAVEKHRKNIEMEIEAANELLIKGLERMKLELSTEYELMCSYVEGQMNYINQNIEFERKRNSIAEKVRHMIKDTITISTDALEILNQHPEINRIQILSLEEQMRLSTSQYTKMIKICA